MKTYELIINKENKKAGVDYIALVDRPAIESDWLVFSEDEKQVFKIKDKEKRIVSGYFMIANKPIYRNDKERGEHNIFFSSDTVINIQRDFMYNDRNTNTNLMHEDNLKMDDVVIFEHIVLDKERGAKPFEGFKVEDDGSWFGSMYVPEHKVKLWSLIEEGKFRGFSVEGFFSYVQDHEQQTLRSIKEVLNSTLEDAQKEESIKILLKNITQ